MSDWRKKVVEIKDRDRLVELINFGDILKSGVAKLRLPGFDVHSTLMGLLEAQQAYKEQLAEFDSRPKE